MSPHNQNQRAAWGSLRRAVDAATTASRTTSSSETSRKTSTRIGQATPATGRQSAATSPTSADPLQGVGQLPHRQLGAVVLRGGPGVDLLFRAGDRERVEVQLRRQADQDRDEGEYPNRPAGGEGDAVERQATAVRQRDQRGEEGQVVDGGHVGLASGAEAAPQRPGREAAPGRPAGGRSRSARPGGPGRR